MELCFNPSLHTEDGMHSGSPRPASLVLLAKRGRENGTYPKLFLFLRKDVTLADLQSFRMINLVYFALLLVLPLMLQCARTSELLLAVTVATTLLQSAFQIYFHIFSKLLTYTLCTGLSFWFRLTASWQAKTFPTADMFCFQLAAAVSRNGPLAESLKAVPCFLGGTWLVMSYRKGIE